MATKTISIDMEAYERLKRRKKEGESFSEVIKRLVSKPVDVDEWLRRIQANGPVSEEFVAAVEGVIAERRAPWNMGMVDGMSRHKRTAGSTAKSKKKPLRRTPRIASGDRRGR